MHNCPTNNGNSSFSQQRKNAYADRIFYIGVKLDRWRVKISEVICTVKRFVLFHLLLLEKDPRKRGYYIYILIHRTDCNLKESFEGYYFFIII